MKKMLIIFLTGIISVHAGSKKQQITILRKYIQSYIAYCRNPEKCSERQLLSMLQREADCIKLGCWDKLEELEKYHQKKMDQVSDSHFTADEKLDNLEQSAKEFLMNLEKETHVG